ncbi:MAG: endopeptidase La [bacterium]
MDIYDALNTRSQDLKKISSTLPLIPVRDLVVYPYMILPLFIGRKKSIAAVQEAMNNYDQKIFLAAQKDPKIDDPSSNDIYQFGTIVSILKVLKLTDGRIRILVHGMIRAKLKKYQQQDPLFITKLHIISDPEVTDYTLEVEALMRNVRSQLEASINIGKALVPDVMVVAMNIEDPGKLADIIVGNLNLKVEESQIVLEIIDPVERLKKVNDLLAKELEVLAMQRKIQMEADQYSKKDHREYLLRQQMKAIQHELGQIDDKTAEIDELKLKVAKAKMPSQVEKEALKQINRLERMPAEAVEASVVRTYVEWLIEVPWNKQTDDNLDIKKASEVLDEDHYDLNEVKERLLEYLSVRKLKHKMKGPMLCFVGPPGVGKTSLGKSIARALGRKFFRISLGGVKDEAEIRGHRRTYVGAFPGKIIQGLCQLGSNNPIFMLDEVDKIGSDFRGDPSAALLEVLDPEQNVTFVDHYLGVPFDLSNVIFIVTANLLEPILPAFRDRMEILHLPGYTEFEKLKIAKKFLIPKQLEENGISSDQLAFTDEALLKIIREYTREAGLRELERKIAAIARKRARKVAEENNTSLITVNSPHLKSYLGIPKFHKINENETDEIGLTTGLAWTESGGDIIHVEATTMKGKGELITTGSLGNVMQESAHAASSFIRSKAEMLGINPDSFSMQDMHINVPAGAIPKDGPSAGITIAISLISALTKKLVRKDIAMTGEITLRGRILPVGGLKEKVMAAKRAGITNLIIPYENKKDILDISEDIRSNTHFIYAKKIDDILGIVFKES